MNARENSRFQQLIEDNHAKHIRIFAGYNQNIMPLIEICEVTEMDPNIVTL